MHSRSLSSNSSTLLLPVRLDSRALRYSSPLAATVVPQAVSRPCRGWIPQGNEASGRSGTAIGPVEQAASDLQRLEGVLFLASEPLSTRKLAKLAGLADGTLARSLVRQLNSKLRGRSSGLEIVEVAGGWQMMTRPEAADWVARLHGGGEDLRLSAPALETLAVVAYRQPVVRAEIEAIRGVQCGEMLRVLMERSFLRIVGRSEELGRPFLYGTTRNFLQVFGLRRLEELPRIDQTLYASKPVGNEPAASLPKAA